MTVRLDKQDIVQFYKGCEKRPRSRLPRTLSGFTLTNTALGLGDTLILTDLPRHSTVHQRPETIYSASRHFNTLVDFNPYFSAKITPFWVAADRLAFCYDLGNGHIIQRLQRAFGFEPDLQPRGCIVAQGEADRSADVILHFEAGRHVEWQRANIHPRAREIYPESRTSLQNFIRSQPSLRFAEVGNRFSGLEGVHDWTGISVDETVRRMANAKYFIGIMSGPLHIAAALNLRLIAIINFPHPQQICQPTLVDFGLVESEWFYPQSVLLHQDGEAKFIKKLSSDNLKRAFNGEIYPYWSTAYLDLIHELQ